MSWIGYVRDLTMKPPWRWTAERTTERDTEWEALHALRKRYFNLTESFSLVACEKPNTPTKIHKRI